MQPGARFLSPAVRSDARVAYLALCSTYQALVVWQHDNDLRIVIPDHSPEVLSCVGQRVLGDDELVAPVVTLTQQRQKHVVIEPNTPKAISFCYRNGQRCFA